MGNKRKLGDDAETLEGGNEDEQMAAEVKLIGVPIKKSGKGRSERRFYSAFELDGSHYSLEDSVLIAPEEKSKKPYVAIIKDIKQSRDGSVMITGQWFYRPEEAEKRGGGCYEADDARELFYSFHRDDVPAESVMHKCVVYFIPSQKMSPSRESHPGFIVRKVYDAAEKKLWSLTDKDYEDSKQKEINLLVQKTQQDLGGEFVDMDAADGEVTDNAERLPRRGLRKKGSMRPPSLIVGKEEPAAAAAAPEVETPADTAPPPSTPMSDQAGKSNQRHGTGNSSRDKWVEKLMQCVDYLCKSPSSADASESVEAKEDGLFSTEQVTEAISGLERAVHESIGDVKKYNIKMRSLDYNLKHHRILTRRLVAKELDPMTVATMSPVELKDGMTAAEKSAQEPQQPQVIQIASVRCGVCGEPQVGVKDIINALHGDRYQLECPKCGNAWYSPRDVISSLTIGTVKPNTPVGTAPWATSKFEEAQKDIAAAHEKDAEKEKPGDATSPSTKEEVPGKDDVSMIEAQDKDEKQDSLQDEAVQDEKMGNEDGEKDGNLEDKKDENTQEEQGSLEQPGEAAAPRDNGQQVEDAMAVDTRDDEEA